MTTAEGGGSTVNTSSSPYGVGGVGGKFRKKPFRRQGTPYDRPATALRGNVHKPGGWLSTLVLEPAYKLVSYGANRFFASVFRKRLPAPPPPQQPVASHDINAAVQGADLDDKEATVDPVAGDCSCPIKSSNGNEISELEQLLKEKKFTRSEIVHLTALLQSKAELSPGDGIKAIEKSASDFGRHLQFFSGPMGENGNDGSRSSAPILTPLLHSKVCEDGIASPTELAKSYMGTRTSKLSPSVLGIQHHTGREDTGLPSNGIFAAKSPAMSLNKKNPVSFAPENGFASPRSRGRSAIYNMARTPYSRDRPTSILKGSGVSTNSYTGHAISSSSLHPLEDDENYGSRSKNLKRRSSLLEYEIGSVGPIRRIRQKSNLMVPRVPHITDGGSSSKAKKLGLIGEPSGKISRNSVENEKQTPVRSFAHVPSRSTEVAAKILQQLEKMSPKEKSSVSESIGGGDKSHMKLTTNMLSGKALRSMENVDSLKLPMDIQDDERLGDRQNESLPDDRHPSKGNTNGEENVRKESFFPLGNWNSDMNNGSALTSKSLRLNTDSSVSTIKDSSPEPSQKKRAFRMSAQEDMLELDDDIQSNGPSSRPFSKNAGVIDAPSTESRLQPSEEPKLAKATIQRESVSPSASIGSKISEFGGADAFGIGEISSSLTFPAFGDAPAVSQSEIFPLPVGKPKEANGPSQIVSFGEISSSLTFPAFGDAPAVSQSEIFPLPVGKPKEANGPSQIVSFSAQDANNFSSLPSGSTTKAESKLESSSSLINFSPSTGSQVKFPESDKGGNLSHVAAGDANGKSETVSFAANGSHASSPFMLPFGSSSSSGTTQKSTGSPFLFTPSTAAADITTSSTSAPSGNSVFGLDTRTSSLAGPSFGVATPPSTATISEVPDLSANAEMNGSSSSSSGSHSTMPAVGAANSGSATFELGSYFSQSTAANIQGSVYGDSSRTLESGAGTLPQKSSLEAASSLPSFSVNSSTSFGSSSNSQAFNSSDVFASTASTSSSNASAIVPGSLAASNVVKHGAIPAAIEGSAVNFSSGSTGFNLGSSSVGTSAGATHQDFNASSSAKAAGSNSGVSQANFIFAAGSSSSAPAINATRSSGIFQFAGSSTGSPAINSITTSSSPSVFGSSWQGTKSPTFGSTFTSQSPSTGLAFAFPTASNPSSPAPPAFGSSTGVSSSNLFSYTAPPASVISSQSLPTSQPVFGKSPATGFAASPGNNDLMNAEDNSMAEDPVQSSSPAVPVFGQPFAPQSAPSPVFGSTAPLLGNPFMFNSQPNQASPSPFQASGSQEFNGGVFSMGSGGTSGKPRTFLRVSKNNKNRKK